MISKLKFFCQRVLPVVYDDSLSYQELLYKVVGKLNEMVDLFNDLDGSIIAEIDQIMQGWLADGTLADIIGDSISDLGDRMDAVETDITNINNDITALSEADTALSAQLNALRASANNRKFLWIGDSYGMRNTPNWMSILRNLLGGVGMAVSSYGFTPIGYQFITLLNTLYSQSTDPAEITDIVVCGGWNDAREIHSGNQTAATLQSAIFNFVDRAADIFPNATVWIGFMGWQSGDVVQAGADLTSLNIAQRVYQFSRRKGLKVLTHCAYPMRLPYNMDTSYFHPNSTTGAEWLAFTVGADLFGGADYNQWYTVHEDAWVDATGITNFTLGVFASNNLIKWNTNYFTLNKDTGFIGKFKPYYNPVAMQSDQHFLEADFEGTINGETFRGTLGIVMNYSGEVWVIWQGGLNNISQITGLIKLRDIYTAESLTENF